MSNLTNEQKVQAALDAAIPDIVETLKQELIRGITYEIRNKIQSQIAGTVEEWYKTSMVDEVKTALVDSKLGILGGVVPFAEELQKALLRSMIDVLTKNLTQSYSRTRILEALFK